MSKSERMKRLPELHKEDRTLELASALGLTFKEWLTAFTLKERILNHERWSNQRSPHALMVDCIHIVGNYTKNKAVTQVSIMQKTKELWGIGANSRPSKWKKYFQSEIERVLNVLNNNNEDILET